MLIKLLQCIEISDLWDITQKGNKKDAKFQKLTGINPCALLSFAADFQWDIQTINGSDISYQWQIDTIVLVKVPLKRLY